MHHEGDVVVIGGGAIGIAAAYYLQQAGRHVTVLERSTVCSACSSGNAGLIVPSHVVPLAAPGVVAQGLRWLFNRSSPFYITPRPDTALAAWLWQFRNHCTEAHVRYAVPVLRDLGLTSAELYAELSALEGMDFGYTRKGLVMLFSTEKGRRANLHEGEQASAAGLDAEELDRDALFALEPYAPLDALGGVYYRQDNHLEPARFVLDLSAYIQRQGATVLEGVEVTGFERTGRAIGAVQTSRGRIQAREVVLAAGSWSPVLGHLLGLKLPVQPAKGYSLTLLYDGGLRLPLILTEARATITPMRGQIRFGGTLALSGYDPSIDRRRVQPLLDLVPTYLPGIDPAAIPTSQVWSGFRPATPDGLPLIGRATALGNLTVATGHAMLGLTMAPITGKLVAEILTDQSPSLDLAPLRVERFN